MDLRDEIVSVVRAGGPYRDNARDMHYAVETALHRCGWSTDREVRVDYRRDGRIGHVDIVAYRNGVSVAIEMDHRTPRKKSLAKLASLKGEVALRAVTLRSECPPFVTDDGVVVFGAGIIGGEP